MMTLFESSKSFCRVCMDTSSTQIDFGVFFRNENDFLTYMDCFEFVTRIKIDLKSNLQQHLCTECADVLRSAFTFIRKAEIAEKKLQGYIENRNLNKLVEENLLDLVEETNSDNKSLTELSSIGGQESELDSLSAYTELDLEAQSNETEADIPIIDEEIPIECQREKIEECPSNELLVNVSTTSENFCQECNKNFKNRRSLFQHRNRFHQNINNCGDLEQLQEGPPQQDFHTENRCEICSKTFKSHSLLRTHLRYHDRKLLSKKSDACPICDKRFATAFYLRQHTQLVHADERPQLPCDQCNKIYMTKNALENHKRVHTGQTLECHECGKSFVNPYELKIHLRFHTLDYPFQCKICNKQFAIKGHLRTHMWQHEGLKLQCESCGKLFTSTKALLEHSYSHAKELPFPCCYCSKSYPSKQKYKVHLKTVHTVEFDEMEHLFPTPKMVSRKKKLTLVQADNVMKEIEIKSKGSEYTEDFILEIG